ncbi:hypothetical protein [Actinacidiphila acidipaludis]|uniref:Integral membrane protein n=1 Tax=Actinacidiphila acidipaludis TaxID=2873382 RepID=A0ABS7Q266_9ACTN|nr:hypothetical protein [Streptomyces acidipaludis]MBY8876976.1 hypothetical protein [Streptomyces acidipaludis]
MRPASDGGSSAEAGAAAEAGGEAEAGVEVEVETEDVSEPGDEQPAAAGAGFAELWKMAAEVLEPEPSGAKAEAEAASQHAEAGAGPRDDDAVAAAPEGPAPGAGTSAAGGTTATGQPVTVPETPTGRCATDEPRPDGGPADAATAEAPAQEIPSAGATGPAGAARERTTAAADGGPGCAESIWQPATPAATPAVPAPAQGPTESADLGPAVAGSAGAGIAEAGTANSGIATPDRGGVRTADPGTAASVHAAAPGSPASAKAAPRKAPPGRTPSGDAASSRDAAPSRASSRDAPPTAPASGGLPRRRGPADPVRQVMHRHQDLIAGAVDVWEIAAGLEAHGVTDVDARRLRHRDVFGLAEELYARVPRAGQAAAAVRGKRESAWLNPAGAARYLLPGAVCAVASRFLPDPAVTALVLLAGYAVLRRGPLHARGPLAALAACVLLALTTPTAPGLAASLLPAAYCAHWFAVRSRAQLAPSQSLDDFADAVRPRLGAALAGYTVVLVALLGVAGPVATPAALGLLLFTARLLALHGRAAFAAAVLAAACAAEAPFRLAAALGTGGPHGTAQALVCAAAAAVAVVQAFRVLPRAAAHRPN